jgi:glycerol-3-phosphate dehydrogenase
VSFAVPWEDMLLLGTTDTLYDGEPGAVDATDADVAQILDEALVAVEPELLARDRIRSTFAGLRVLPSGDGETARAKRETVFHRGSGGMLTVAGGKLTTYRRIAIDALAMLGLRVDRRPFPLPGAGARAAFDPRLDVDARVRSHLWNHYGTLANDVLAPAAESPELLRPLHPEGPDIAAQVVYAREHEWAQTTDDVVRRRTTLGVRGFADDAAPAVEELMESRVRPQV